MKVVSLLMEGPLIDWHAFYELSINGQLMELLVKLPRERWAERNEYGATLLHYACSGPNVAAVVALLQSGLMDMNARAQGGWALAHYAAKFQQPRVLEVLCATGANLRARDDDGNAPIELALVSDGGETVRVLVANGVRLGTVRTQCCRAITCELEAFEQGVLHCRAAVATMLCVKRASGGQLVRWDKFLLAEMALCVWCTRYDKGWQPQ